MFQMFLPSNEARLAEASQPAFCLAAGGNLHPKARYGRISGGFPTSSPSRGGSPILWAGWLLRAPFPRSQRVPRRGAEECPAAEASAAHLSDRRESTPVGRREQTLLSAGRREQAPIPERARPRTFRALIAVPGRAAAGLPVPSGGARRRSPLPEWRPSWLR